MLKGPRIISLIASLLSFFGVALILTHRDTFIIPGGIIIFCNGFVLLLTFLGNKLINNGKLIVGDCFLRNKQ